MNCSRCNQPATPCDPCSRRPECGCPKPILEIEDVPESVAVLRYNFQGFTTYYDYGNMIEQTQTDTFIKADAINRVLTYMAERHTDTISAKELGALLHISDLGDVDITGVTDNSLFVYKKDNDCAHGCIGIANSWIAWNASDNMASSLATIMGFDSNGTPQALLPPANTNQFYTLGWNAGSVGYHQPQERTMQSVAIEEDGSYYAYQRFIDPNTFEEVYVKVEVQV